MEIPRWKRGQLWRYGLGVIVCDDCGRAQSECPAGVRNFVEGRETNNTAEALVFEGLAVVDKNQVGVE